MHGGEKIGTYVHVIVVKRLARVVDIINCTLSMLTNNVNCCEKLDTYVHYGEKLTHTGIVVKRLTYVYTVIKTLIYVCVVVKRLIYMDIVVEILTHVYIAVKRLTHMYMNELKRFT